MSTCHLFLFIDALGHAVVRDQPVISDLGTCRALRSVFGYSSACVPSILTGRLPQDHGHWSFFTHQGPRSGLRVPWWLHLLPSGLRDRGRVRSRLSPAVARANGLRGYFQLYQMPLDVLPHYGWCEPKNIFKPDGFNRGRGIFDVLAERRTRAWVSDWHVSEAANWAGAKAAAGDRDISFVFLYAASMDAWLHDHTRQHADLPQQLHALRRRIDAVLRAARAQHDQVRFHIFSDHGMCTVRRHLDVFPLLAASGLTMHRDYFAVIDSTMVRLWHGDEATRTRLRACLDGVVGLTRQTPEQLAAVGCAFPDRRFGDDIYLAEPGLLLHPSHLGSTPLKAMHGYSLDHEDSDAVHISNDPAAAPTCITDIYGLMEASA